MTPPSPLPEPGEFVHLTFSTSKTTTLTFFEAEELAEWPSEWPDPDEVTDA